MNSKGQPKSYAYGKTVELYKKGMEAEKIHALLTQEKVLDRNKNPIAIKSIYNFLNAFRKTIHVNKNGKERKPYTRRLPAPMITLPEYEKVEIRPSPRQTIIIVTDPDKLLSVLKGLS